MVRDEPGDLILRVKHGMGEEDVKLGSRWSSWRMKETLLGLALAASVNSIVPVGYLVKHYLGGAIGYLFAVVFGLIMYICATMGVPLVDALIKQGMDKGAGFVLLLIGPITSYGTILVLRKEFGMKVLLVYLGLICSLALILGCIFTFI